MIKGNVVFQIGRQTAEHHLRGREKQRDLEKVRWEGGI